MWHNNLFYTTNATISWNFTKISTPTRKLCFPLSTCKKEAKGSGFEAELFISGHEILDWHNYDAQLVLTLWMPLCQRRIYTSQCNICSNQVFIIRTTNSIYICIWLFVKNICGHTDDHWKTHIYSLGILRVKANFFENYYTWRSSPLISKLI